MVRVRRIAARLPFVKRYELQIGLARSVRLRRSRVVRRLNAAVGADDAMAFIDEADWRWAAGHGDWTVEYEDAPESDHPRARVRSGMEFENWSRTWSDPDITP
jgi:hypothetical protein